MANHDHVDGMPCLLPCPAFDPSGPIVPAPPGPEVAPLTEYAANMTLRDHFAGIALSVVVTPTVNLNPTWEEVATNMAETARGAYMLADAMMAAREAKRG